MPVSIPFEALGTSEFFIHHVFASEKEFVGESNNDIRSRGNNLLFLLKRDERDYLFERQCLHATAGALLFMPTGCSYRAHVPAGMNNLGLSVVFKLETPQHEPIHIQGDPRILCMDGRGDYDERMSQILRDVLGGGKRILRAKAMLYQVLYMLLPDGTPIDDASFALLQPALTYMETHLQQNLTIAELAARCMVSESTFYRRFRAYTGQSPLMYHQRLRIQRGRDLLESGLYTVEQASEILGFCNSAYFSRCYYQITGQHASDARRNHFL